MGEVTFLDVSKRFSLRVDGEVHHVQALDRVNFTVMDGEIVALIGPSGCGKTTALRVTMGLDPASGGRVIVDGREVTGCGQDRGMVFQHAELLPWLSAAQNVMFGLEMKGIRGATLREIAEKYLNLVALTDSQNRRPHQLSGGMKQGVGIACPTPPPPLCPQGPPRRGGVRCPGPANAGDTSGRVVSYPRPHRQNDSVC